MVKIQGNLIMAIANLDATFNFTIRQQRAVVATPLALNRV